MHNIISNNFIIIYLLLLSEPKKIVGHVHVHYHRIDQEGETFF